MLQSDPPGNDDAQAQSEAAGWKARESFLAELWKLPADELFKSPIRGVRDPALRVTEGEPEFVYRGNGHYDPGYEPPTRWIDQYPFTYETITDIQRDVYDSVHKDLEAVRMMKSVLDEQRGYISPEQVAAIFGTVPPDGKVATISELEFRRELEDMFRSVPEETYSFVTGPGRSGAVAAVYASHLLGVPFVPYGHDIPTERPGRLLIIDTVTHSGKTLRKARNRYAEHAPVCMAVFNTHTRGMHRFWYERGAA